MASQGEIGCWQCHETDQVLPTTVDQRRHRRAPITSTRPPTSGKPSWLRSTTRGASVDPPVEPGLDGVAIRRDHIYRCRGHERAQMTATTMSAVASQERTHLKPGCAARETSGYDYRGGERTPGRRRRERARRRALDPTPHRSGERAPRDWERRQPLP